jgi:hypothetical protein
MTQNVINEYRALQIEQQRFEEEEAQYFAEQEYKKLMDAYTIVLENLEYYGEAELFALFNKATKAGRKTNVSSNRKQNCNS